MSYTAVMIDICGSTKIPQGDRGALQEYIEKCIGVLNALYREELAKPVDFSGGDAVQGLFAQASAAFLYARLYLMLLHPVKVRCGFGVGTWAVRNEGSTNAQDGTSYHEARRAVDIAHDDPRRSMVLCSDSGNEIELNALMLGTSTIRSALTERQACYQLLLEAISPLTVRKEPKKDFTPLYGLLSSGERNQLVNRFFRRDKSYYTLEHFASDIFQSNFEPYAVEYPADGGPVCVETKRKGYAKILAEITRVTRQNVENALSTGRAYTLRDLDCAIALALKQRLGGR